MNILIYELTSSNLTKKYIRYTIDRKRFNLFPAHKHMGPTSVAYRANRIWDWDTETDSVQYLKDRTFSGRTSVDRKEFFLVQLKAEEWQRETA